MIDDHKPRARSRRRRWMTGAIAATAAAGTAIGGSFWIRADAGTRETEVVRYTFEQTDGALFPSVTGGPHLLKTVSSKGGALTPIAHGGGTALQFPPPCRTEPCPRVALRAKNSAGLNPGRKPIRFGATVLLDKKQTTKGENIIQKGYSAGGSQFKLQIDGKAGKPSCAMVDAKGAVHIARSSVTVADSEWHTLECRRKGSWLAIRVDGRRRGSATIPADLSVSNSIPLSIGGKGAYRDNDQFQGALDDVWVAIG
ncbi:LamG-like jellyroll fold domain-containing protein [Actinoplanes sp. NPDC051859]|uniref:LamG-like jellyroll fold domain-containing protein n=1 Tax=Actinoplanes sp. NPDC051859 TaxID=3363909 RepID=UPI0037BB1909